MNDIKAALERTLEYNVNQLSSEIGKRADAFYLRHFNYREKNPKDKDKEFRLQMERAHRDNKMISKQIENLENVVKEDEDEEE